MSVYVPSQLSVFHDKSGFSRCTLLTVSMDRVTASVNESQKVVYNNVTVSFDVVTGSYLYPDQLQIVARTTEKPHMKQRSQSHNGQSYRIEPFYLDLNLVPELLWSLMQQFQKWQEMTNTKTTHTSTLRILTGQSNVADILR